MRERRKRGQARYGKRQMMAKVKGWWGQQGQARQTVRRAMSWDGCRKKRRQSGMRRMAMVWVSVKVGIFRFLSLFTWTCGWFEAPLFSLYRALGRRPKLGSVGDVHNASAWLNVETHSELFWPPTHWFFLRLEQDAVRLLWAMRIGDYGGGSVGRGKQCGRRSGECVDWRGQYWTFLSYLQPYFGTTEVVCRFRSQTEFLHSRTFSIPKQIHHQPFLTGPTWCMRNADKCSYLMPWCSSCLNTAQSFSLMYSPWLFSMRGPRIRRRFRYRECVRPNWIAGMPGFSLGLGNVQKQHWLGVSWTEPIITSIWHLHRQAVHALIAHGGIVYLMCLTFLTMKIQFQIQSFVTQLYLWLEWVTIRELKWEWHDLIRPYKLNNNYIFYNSDEPSSEAIKGSVASMNLTRSLSLTRIANSA